MCREAGGLTAGEGYGQLYCEDDVDVRELPFCLPPFAGGWVLFFSRRQTYCAQNLPDQRGKA